MFRIPALALAGMLAVSTSACSIDVDRNADGSLQVSTTISETSLASEIEAGIANPAIENVDVDLQDGFVDVSATRARPGGGGSDTMTFRVDLGVSDGRLDVVVSEVEVAGHPVDEAVVGNWNATLSNKLERAARRNPDATLQAVSITGDEVSFSWRVETARSR